MHLVANIEEETAYNNQQSRNLNTSLPPASSGEFWFDYKQQLLFLLKFY